MPAPLPQATTPDAASSSATMQGMQLLKASERGKGPSLAIEWPSGNLDRFYRAAKKCLGMTAAMMDAAGKLYRAADPSGTPWFPSSQLFSGLIRRPGGTLPANARRDLDAVRVRHPGVRGVPVFLVARRTDEVLLGRLAGIVPGGGINGRHTVRGRYTLGPDGIAVAHISIDGNAVPGRIKLSACRG